uniref:Uncharacterized protein n=1 Tax=Alexandrium monilatum TaxID=311494 RepID=A0A6T1MV80_9DINO
MQAQTCKLELRLAASPPMVRVPRWRWHCGFLRDVTVAKLAAAVVAPCAVATLLGLPTAAPAGDGGRWGNFHTRSLILVTQAQARGRAEIQGQDDGALRV